MPQNEARVSACARLEKNVRWRPMMSRTGAGTDSPSPAELTEQPTVAREKPKRPTERTAMLELERAQFAELIRTLDE